MSKTTDQLKKQFALITKAGAKLDAFIQTTGVDVLEHFIEHKDARVVDSLYKCLGKGARHAAMASWILTHFAVVANDGDNKAERPFLNCKDKDNDLEGAKARPWYDFKPSPKPDQIMDLQALVRAMLKKAGASPCVIGNPETLQKLAEAVGIPVSDVPSGVKLAANKAEAEALMAKAE